MSTPTKHEWEPSFPESPEQLRYVAEHVRQMLLMDGPDLKRRFKTDTQNTIIEAIKQALAQWPIYKAEKQK